MMSPFTCTVTVAEPDSSALTVALLPSSDAVTRTVAEEDFQVNSSPSVSSSGNVKGRMWVISMVASSPRSSSSAYSESSSPVTLTDALRSVTSILKVSVFSALPCGWTVTVVLPCLSPTTSPPSTSPFPTTAMLSSALSHTRSCAQ